MKTLIVAVLGIFSVSLLLAQSASALCIYGKIVPIDDQGNFLVGAEDPSIVVGLVTSDLSDIALNEAAYYEFKVTRLLGEDFNLVKVKKVDSCRI